MNPIDPKHHRESTIFRRIPWQDVCKFLAGAFFETSGILFYVWLYRIPMPIFSTGFIQTPGLGGFRSIVNTVLFLCRSVLDVFLPRFHS